MLYKLGGTIIAFGIMCADSKSLVIPLVIVLFGAFLVKIGERSEEK